MSNSVMVRERADQTRGNAGGGGPIAFAYSPKTGNLEQVIPGNGIRPQGTYIEPRTFGLPWSSI